MNQLALTKRYSGGVVILDLAGDICIGDGNLSLRQTMRSLTEQGELRVVLNLAKVAYIDSSGLGELVAAYNTASKNGGQLKLLSLTDRVTELMVITKLLTVFDAYDDEAEAIKAFTWEDRDLTTGPLDAQLAEARVLG